MTQYTPSPEFFHDACMSLELEHYASDCMCQHGAQMDAPDLLPSGAAGSHTGAYCTPRPDIYPH